MSKVYGIDLGTTNTCVSVFRKEGPLVLGIDNQDYVPSIVAYSQEDANFLVGQKARAYSKLHPDHALKSLKRFMGRPEQLFSCGEKKINCIEFSTIILRYIKERALAIHGEDIQEAVITVPAYFNEIQRRSTLEAAGAAGIQVLALANEPTAAGLMVDSLSISGSSDETHEQEIWPVFDLGGGTLDISFIKKTGPLREVIGSSGLNELGGDDFDERLASHLLAQLEQRYGKRLGHHPYLQLELLYVAEKIKKDLSLHSEVLVLETFDYPHLQEKYVLELKITRSFFEELIHDLVQKAIKVFQELIQELNLNLESMDRIILVGGATKIPCIKRALEEQFSLSCQNYIDPDLSVALGSAQYAGLLTNQQFDKIFIDVATFDLGIACLGQEDYEGDQVCERNHPQTFTPIIKRNTKLPARGEETFYTVIPHQDMIELAVYQGLSSKVKENEYIGSYMAPLRPCDENTPLHVVFEYDINGMMKITMKQGRDYLGPDHCPTVQMHVMNVFQSVEENSNAKMELPPSITPEKANAFYELIRLKIEKWQESQQVNFNPELQKLLTKILPHFDRYQAAVREGQDKGLDQLEDILYELCMSVQERENPDIPEVLASLPQDQHDFGNSGGYEQKSLF